MISHTKVYSGLPNFTKQNRAHWAHRMKEPIQKPKWKQGNHTATYKEQKISYNKTSLIKIP